VRRLWASFLGAGVLLAACITVGPDVTPEPTLAPTLGLTSGPTATPSASRMATASPTPVPTASPAPTTGPTRQPDASWVRVADQAAFANAGMVSVVWGPDRYMAVGDAGARTSTDGVSWRIGSAPFVGRGMVRGSIYDRIGYVAWGSSGMAAAVWVSPDGAAWSRAPDTPSFQGAEVTGVARLRDDLVAVGYADNDFRTWTSSDGLVWEPVSPATSTPWDGYVYGVTTADAGLVAWGNTRGDASSAATLRSTDGRHWEVSVAGLEAEGDMVEGITEIIAVGGRLVAVGHGPLIGEAGAPPPPAAAWTSDDGLLWTPAVFEPEPPHGWFTNVVWNGEAFVALGFEGPDSFDWRSTDGTTWTQAPSAPDTARDGEEEGCTGGRCPRSVVNYLASGAAGLVAVGSTRSGSEDERAVVWIAPAGGG